MSLFYTPREVRIINPKKRKKEPEPNEIEIQEMYSCDWCSDEYDSETELYVHKRVKHRPNLFQLASEENVCKTCVSSHESQQDLINHIKSMHLLSSEDAEHVQREIFICDLCGVLYFNKAMLALHMQYVHDPAHKYRLSGTCPKCNKDIQIRHVWFHFQRHSMQTVSCCQICLKKCKSRIELQEHLKLHPSYLRCTICGYETKAKDNFTAHMQIHDSNLDSSRNIAIDESLLWKCFMPHARTKRCDLSFGVRGLKLNNLGMSICVLCRGMCVEEEKAAHIAKYHLVNIVASKKQYICVCGEQFFNNVLLKHHVFKLKGDHRASDS